MAGERRRGFTLIELLVVIVIIGLLMALLLPAIIKALCAARQGTAEHLVDQLTQACKAYEFDWAAYPPGDGDGSADMAYRLKPDPTKVKSHGYFEFTPDMICAKGVVNPVWPQDTGDQGVIHYRNNAAAGTGTGGGGGGGGKPTVRHTRSFDMWCAGCNYNSGNQATNYEVNNWE